MSELILSWLNNDMHLSRKVSSFEQDFSNGYLFGEILAKYNQQLNFSQFINKTDKDSKLNNFTLLFDTFKSLRVTFDTNIVMDIIEEKEGVSKKILYQLKMQLERSTSTLSAKAMKTGLTPLKKVEVGKEKKDQLDSKLFRRGLQTKHKAQKKIDEEQVLKKFSDFHQIEKEKERLIKESEMREIQLRNEHLRNRMRTDFKRVQEFSKQWEKEGVKNWSNNMEIRKNQSAKDSQYRAKLQSSIKQGSLIKEAGALRQVSNDIEEFENKFNLTRKNEDQQEDRVQPQHQKSSIQFTSKVMGNYKSELKSELRSELKRGVSGYKSKKNLNPDQSNRDDYNRKQRDKKRRMMIVNQSKHQSLIELQRREQELMFNLQQTSKQEKQIQYEIWRARQNKTIIVENRKLREVNYQQKEEARRLNAEFKNDELLRTLREEHLEELNCRLKRHNQLEVNHRINQRKEVYDELSDNIFQLLEIAEKCFEYTQNTNSHEIQGPFLNQLLQQFIQKQGSDECVAEKELQNYVQGEGVWKFEVERLNSEPVEPEKQNSIPSVPINNYFLGNILKDIYSKYFPKVDGPQPQINCEFGMCLLGLECSGKKTIAKHISEQFSLEIIDPEEMFSELMRMMAEKEHLEGPEKELFHLGQSGQNIPDELMFHFIKEAMLQHPRFLLIGYPRTYQQALFLTKALSNIQPHDSYEATLLQTRLENIHRLVKSTPSTIQPWKIKSCGIDLFLWLETSPSTSIDRFIGLRSLENQQVHINNPNLNGCDAHQLEMGDRGISVVEKNSFILNNLKDVKEWLSKFGAKDDEGMDAICWKQISANKELGETIEDSLSIVFDIQESKRAQEEQSRQQQQNKIKQKEEQELRQKQKAELREKCILSSKEEIEAQLSIGLLSLQLKPQFISSWAQLYQKTESNLISLYLKAFTNVRKQRQDNIVKLSYQKRRFISQLNRQDRKFEAVKKFQLDYNQFVLENRDMVEEGQTKEELHQRVDDLEDRIIEIIDSKKTDAEEERNSFINSGWLESELEYFYNSILILVQTEIQRTFVNQQVISDFYTATNSLESTPTTDFSTQLVIDQSLEIINEAQFPRIQKLFAEANRIFNREEMEIVDDKNKKGGKPPPKKEQKKVGKKKDEVEEKKEPTKQEAEMVTALNTQKSVFRYRLNILKQFAKQESAKLKLAGTVFYKDLQKLILYTEKTELTAMRELSKIIRGYIQGEQMIQREIGVNVFDVYLHHNLLNFEDPKPVIKPAKEQVFPNKFTIAHLAYMINNLLEEGEKFTKRIANHKLLIVLVRTTNHRQTSLRLPEDWRSHEFEDYEVMIRNLDFNKSGFVLLENLFVFFILCNLQIPSKEQLAQWKRNLLVNDDPLIGKEEFINTEAWFDQLERQEQQTNTYYFDRPQKLKELLFQQLKTKQEKLNVNKLISLVGLEQFSKLKKTGQTYYHYIFNK